MFDEKKSEARKELALKRKKELAKARNAKLSPKTKRTLRMVLAALVLVIIVGVIMFTSAGFVKRAITAVKVGDEKVSVAEFNYYYAQQAQTVYNTYYQYFSGSYLPFDTTEKLSSQSYSDTQTWADYLTEQAITTITQVKIMNQEAEKAGYLLSADGQLTVDETMASIAAYASASSMTLDKYLVAMYGNGANEELVRKVLTEVQLASEYDELLYYETEYDEEALNTYYEENSGDFNYVDIRYYPFTASEATDTVPEVTLEQANDYAQRVLNGTSSPETYSSSLLAILTERAQTLYGEDTDTSSYGDSSEHLEVTKASLESVDANLAEWAFDEERKVADKAVIANAEGTGSYVVYLEQTKYRNDYNSVNLRELYLAYDTDSTGDATAEALTKAESYLEEWQAGEATEETFAELCDTYSEASLEGGLVEQCEKGTDLVSEWAFSEERQAGDVTVIQGESGCYVVYYIGQDKPYWLVQVESALRSSDYNTMYEALEEQYPVTRNNFGLSMRVEPFL